MKSLITVCLAINKERESIDESRQFLKNQLEILEFLNPVGILVDSITNYSNYQYFCISEIDLTFDTEFVLIVQRDGFVVNPLAWSEEYLKYDYIGAPWENTSWLSKRLSSFGKNPENDNLKVGNGGFSLRSKKLCMNVRLLSKLYRGENEDAFICVSIRNLLEKNGINFAPYDIASKFSVEHEEYVGQFGCHDWVTKNGKLFNLKHMTIEEIKNFPKQCVI